MLVMVLLSDTVSSLQMSLKTVCSAVVPCILTPPSQFPSFSDVRLQLVLLSAASLGALQVSSIPVRSVAPCALLSPPVHISSPTQVPLLLLSLSGTILASSLPSPSRISSFTSKVLLLSSSSRFLSHNEEPLLMLSPAVVSSVPSLRRSSFCTCLGVVPLSSVSPLRFPYSTDGSKMSEGQGRICTGNCTCCYTEIEAADHNFHLTQSQYTDTGSTSPSADPITPGAWQGSHWSANF